MNTKNEKIDVDQLKKVSREFYNMQELANHIRGNMGICWSWGTHAFVKMNDMVLRFKVNGHHHKGHVYLCVNGADLFDVYLTTTHGKIVDILNDVYLEDLIDRIDVRVEKIAEYTH
jgi:hypothetical protein